MRFWLYLIAKFALVAALAYGLRAALVAWYLTKGNIPKYDPAVSVFKYLLLCIGLVAVGLFYLAIWDQRRRCRSCLRRLIMPVATGSWGHIVLFGQPRTVWICPFGHGTLSIAELQIAGRERPDWQPHDDNIWKELESYYQARK